MQRKIPQASGPCEGRALHGNEASQPLYDQNVLMKALTLYALTCIAACQKARVLLCDIAVQLWTLLAGRAPTICEEGEWPTCEMEDDTDGACYDAFEKAKDLEEEESQYETESYLVYEDPTRSTTSAARTSSSVWVVDSDTAGAQDLGHRTAQIPDLGAADVSSDPQQAMDLGESLSFAMSLVLLAF
mmetsp:Transcript_7340/g.15810  ORF Transcript_7340/g.15810 Transcript_7340/m.15810 type:complete len:187 (-) Transcript_7340:149-709(-)